MVNKMIKKEQLKTIIGVLKRYTDVYLFVDKTNDQFIASNPGLSDVCLINLNEKIFDDEKVNFGFKIEVDILETSLKVINSIKNIKYDEKESTILIDDLINFVEVPLIEIEEKYLNFLENCKKINLAESIEDSIEFLKENVEDAEILSKFVLKKEQYDKIESYASKIKKDDIKLISDGKKIKLISFNESKKLKYETTIGDCKDKFEKIYKIFQFSLCSKYDLNVILLKKEDHPIMLYFDDNLMNIRNFTFSQISGDE